MFGIQFERHALSAKYIQTPFTQNKLLGHCCTAVGMEF